MLHREAGAPTRALSSSASGFPAWQGAQGRRPPLLLLLPPHTLFSSSSPDHLTAIQYTHSEAFLVLLKRRILSVNSVQEVLTTFYLDYLNISKKY